jgi:flagellar M-ring protein FliF
LDKLQEVIKQLVGVWQSMSTAKRLALAGLTLAVLIGVSAIAVIGSEVRYATLYSGLDPKDGADVVQKLNELKVPFRIQGDGAIIAVPADRVQTLRLELAGDGLPRGGGVGNEIFDQSRLGSTEFEQQINLRRAMEGELARTIGTIDAVQSARVHLVMPKRRIFSAKSEGASASVILHLRPGAEFRKREVSAIVHLVATAVPDLTDDRVTVVDTNGVTLHHPKSGDAADVETEQRYNEEARNAELAIENRVRSLLERTTGVGSVDVRVKLELDRSSKERTEEHYEPTRTAMRSEQKTEETVGTEGTTVAGVPGAQTNLPDVDPSVASTQDGVGGRGLLKRSHTRNWEIDRVVEKILLPAGNVSRVSVAVLVDGRHELKEGQQVYVPRSAEELDALKAIVRGAVGFDAERGDTIELAGLRFERPPGELEATVEAPQPLWKKYLPHGAAAAAALVLLALGVLVWRGRTKRAVAERTVAELQAKLGEGHAEHPALFGTESNPQLAGDAANLLAEGAPERAPMDPHVAVRRRSEALEIATSDPATAAIVLREWLRSAGPAAVKAEAA